MNPSNSLEVHMTLAVAQFLKVEHLKVGVVVGVVVVVVPNLLLLLLLVHVR